MKKLIIVAVLCFMVSSAFAQSELPKVEIGGGYGFGVFLGPQDEVLQLLGLKEPNSHGWIIGVHVPFTPSFGVEFGGGGGYKSLHDSVFGAPLDVSMNTYGISGGPRYTKRTRKANLFVHGLVGVSRSSARASYLTESDTVSDTGFSFGGGAGFEWNVHPDVAILAPQVDYAVARSGGQFGHGISIGTGVVFRIR
jgi:hypothetical protein